MAKTKTAQAKRQNMVQQGNMDITFLVIVLLLLTIGLIMLFSASYAYAYYQKNDSFLYIKRQLIFAVPGVIVMLVASRFDYRLWEKLALPVMGVAVVLLVIVLFMPKINGARRWIPIGNLTTVQPSEIAKFAVVLIFAKMIMMYGEKMKTVRYGIVPFMIVLGVIAGLMMLEPHLSGTVLIAMIGIVMMFVGGVDLKWFVIGVGVLAAGIVVVVMIPGVISYAEDRLQYWLDPFSDAQGLGYQTIQSLLAIGSGGVMGLGLGNSRQKYLYIPEPQNDFVFAIVCEELGLVGASIIIILFALLVWRGYVIAIRAKDKFGSMIAVGLTTQVGLQAILNMAVVTNTIPNTGISLPFFSYGGSALMMLLGEMGIILSISRRASMEKQ